MEKFRVARIIIVIIGLLIIANYLVRPETSNPAYAAVVLIIVMVVAVLLGRKAWPKKPKSP